MSRRTQVEREAAAVEAIRGWQTDQDIFDEAVAIFTGINRTDARVIDLVQRAGRMTAGEIATAARLTSGAVTAVIDRLEAAGLVIRVRDTADRRKVLVEVTPALDERTAPIWGPVAEEGFRQMSTYSDTEFEVILAFLEMNRAFLSRHTARVYELIAARGSGEDDPERAARDRRPEV